MNDTARIHPTAVVDPGARLGEGVACAEVLCAGTRE